MVTTFLVCSNIRQSMRYLTDLHLGKQRIEGIQIVNALTKGGGWQDHPATVMWRGYEYALMYYVNCAIHEWICRGRVNTKLYYELPDNIVFPWWVEWSKLHRSHRNLLRLKDPLHYNFPYDSEFQGLGYIWPTDEMYPWRDIPVSQLAHPLTERLVNPQYCTAILQDGKRGGEVCDRLLQLHDVEICGLHRRSLMKRLEKERLQELQEIITHQGQQGYASFLTN